MRTLFFAAAALVAASATPAQYRILEIEGNSPGDRFGYAIAGPIDLNGDGFDDILASGWIDDNSRPPWISLRFHSGRDGARLRPGVRANDYYASSLAILGDVSGDKKPDYVVASGNDNDFVWVHRTDGKKLFALVNPDRYSGNGFGMRVALAGDVDRDGTPDILVASHGRTTLAPYACVFSGRNGRLIRKHAGPLGSYLGSSIAGAGDVDRDGYADVMVGADSGHSEVRVYSGKNGTLLRTLKSTKHGHRLALIGDIDKDGYQDHAIGDQNNLKVYSGKTGTLLRSHVGAQGIVDVGDRDRDGHADYALGEHRFGYNPVTRTSNGRVSIVSGKTGTALVVITGNSGEAIGRTIARGGDVNGDGKQDLLVRADNVNGSVIAYSMTPLPLYTDQHAVDLKTGGTQRLFLRAPTVYATRWWIVGSATGISPGVKLGKVTIPLNPDAYTTFTMSFANTPAYANTRGSWGQYSPPPITRAAIHVPRLPTLVGFTTFHAALLIDDKGNPAGATNAVPLRLY